MLVGDFVKLGTPKGLFWGTVERVDGTKILVHDEDDHKLWWPESAVKKAIAKPSSNLDDCPYRNALDALWRRRDKARNAQLRAIQGASAAAHELRP